MWTLFFVLRLLEVPDLYELDLPYDRVSEIVGEGDRNKPGKGL